MNTINYVQLIFACMTSSVIALGSLINSFEKYLPAFIKETFRYGKFSYTGKSSFIKPVKVPKSWFKHFYVFSSVLTIITLNLVVQVYIFDTEPPASLIEILDVCCGILRTPSTSPVSVLLAITLLTIQCVRRFYDTHFVSVFGKNSQMDLVHYIIGHLHYAGAVVAILAEAPKFTSKFEYYDLNLADITTLDIGAIFLFLWACWHQYKVTVILANLRKNKKGEIVTNAHKIPHGDWFNYVSSPHLLAEILMYTSLTILLKENRTWWFVFGWVLSNQVETALLSHWWYEATFENYPKTRKALIPFIY